MTSESTKEQLTTHRFSPRRLLLAAGVALAIGMTTTAFAVTAAAPTSATVCIKPNGQLRVTTPTSPICVEPETRSEWTIDGVKAITAGQGLVARDAGGVVTLDVDPGLVENANSGKIVAGFDDGPHEVPDDLGVVAQLPLPPGNYAIFAKLTLRKGDAEVSPSVAQVFCRLVAGADFDEATAVLEPFDTESALFGGQGTNTFGLNLEVVHHFDGPSRALLFCSDTTLFFFPSGDVVYRDLKIVAIRGASLSNTFIGA